VGDPVIRWVLGAVAAGVIGNAGWEGAKRLSGWVFSSGLAKLGLALAVGVLPSHMRDRYAEEWAAELEAASRKEAVRLILGFLRAAVVARARARLPVRGERSPGAADRESPAVVGVTVGVGVVATFSVRRGTLPFLAGATIVLAGTGVLLWQSPRGGPGHYQGIQQVVDVDNRVTNGRMVMQEDDVPAYLSTVAENHCANWCHVPGSDLRTGDRLGLVCQTVGQPTTNGNRQSPVDDANPALYESHLWYYAVVDGKEGYISEVWISGDRRGGLGLPLC
jgi:hypothetical protein